MLYVRIIPAADTFVLSKLMNRFGSVGWCSRCSVLFLPAGFSKSITLSGFAPGTYTVYIRTICGGSTSAGYIVVDDLVMLKYDDAKACRSLLSLSSGMLCFVAFGLSQKPFFEIYVGRFFYLSDQFLLVNFSSRKKLANSNKAQGGFNSARFWLSLSNQPAFKG